MRYDVLYHTDLGRVHGESNGTRLDMMNWSSYDLVVIDESHNFRSARRAFIAWSKWDVADRTTDKLLRMLDFDFFEVLDSVTIARSRKYIEKYYDMADIGTFPTRLKPISKSPCLTDLQTAINYNEIFTQLMQLNLMVYMPTRFIQASKMEKYAIFYRDNKVNVDFTQANREQGIRRLMGINPEVVGSNPAITTRKRTFLE